MIKQDNKNLKDSELVVLYKNGNSYALDILIARHYKAVLSFMCSKQGPEFDIELSKDFTQEVFAKAIIALNKGKYKESSQFKSWLFKIGHNHLRDYYRKEKGRAKDVIPLDFKYSYKEYLLYNIMEESQNVLEKMEREEMHSYCMKLVEQLPVEQRNVVDLIVFKNLKFKDVAEEQKININTALGRWRYALVNMKDFMKKNPPIWLAS